MMKGLLLYPGKNWKLAERLIFFNQVLLQKSSP